MLRTHVEALRQSEGFRDLPSGALLRRVFPGNTQRSMARARRALQNAVDEMRRDPGGSAGNVPMGARMVGRPKEIGLKQGKRYPYSRAPLSIGNVPVTLGGWR